MTRCRQGELYAGFAGAVVCALVLVVVWVMLLPRVPEGWPVLAADGAGYVLSVIVMVGGYDRLKRAMGPLPALVVTAGTWFVVVLVFRSILSALAGY